MRGSGGREESLTEEGDSRSLRPGCGAFANGYFLTKSGSSHEAQTPGSWSRQEVLWPALVSQQALRLVPEVSPGCWPPDWVCSGFSRGLKRGSEGLESGHRGLSDSVYGPDGPGPRTDKAGVTVKEAQAGWPTQLHS